MAVATSDAEAARWPSRGEREAVVLRGQGLSLDDMLRVARQRSSVRLTDDPIVLNRIAASRAFVEDAVRRGQPIYGITTLFGGMANLAVPSTSAAALQNNLPLSHRTGAGNFLSNEDVRAAMLLRANALLWGASGVRLELIERLILFLNENVTPRVRAHGSIGASGDLVPLAYVTGAICGLAPGYRVDDDGEEIDALVALERLGLSPLPLEAKEALAMMNGTSVMTGVAANCISDTHKFLAGTLCLHALLAQALRASTESFAPFVHRLKPHPGQRWAAQQMLQLLHGSKLVRGSGTDRGRAPGELIQDRYSLRCLPQFLGPIVDGLIAIGAQIEVEGNSATDNPLIDAEAGIAYHGGNFLGQYIGVGMDQLRYHLGMLAKHLDAQIALVVAPEFSNGLPPSLVGNVQQPVNTGLKALQITLNSLAPRLSFFGNSIADRFPTHAEQFNQNVNSQGLGSAVLARESLDTFRLYLAAGLIFGVQAADLRTFAQFHHYDARETLSDATRTTYEAVKQVTGVKPGRARPYVWDDGDQSLDEYISAIVEDLESDGPIAQSFGPVLSDLREFYA
ncbi:MAG: aromatic amino acid ammonia-lyase [Xanthobacteraceae bacterium]